MVHFFHNMGKFILMTDDLYILPYLNHIFISKKFFFENLYLIQLINYKTMINHQKRFFFFQKIYQNVTL